jgi:hypothetical protein
MMKKSRQVTPADACVGLPVTVRINPDGSLEFEVDAGELAHCIRHGDAQVFIAGREVVNDYILDDLATTVEAAVENAAFPTATIPAPEVD